jgi:hypothetical protein
MRLAILLLVVLAVEGRASAQVFMPASGHAGGAVDVDVGGGRASGHGWGFLTGVGLGIYEISDVRYASFTATASYAPWQPFAFGGAVALAHLQTGLGIGAGAHVTTHGVWGLHAGPSLSLLHLEGQLQFEGREMIKALVLFVRVPVGLIVRTLSAPRK